MTALTESQIKALKALAKRGNEGAIDKNGVVVAAGERLKFDSVTWLRLVSLGMLESAGPHRLRLTDQGRGHALMS